MRTKATIALLLPDFRPGGAEKVAILLAESFLDKGFNVFFVVLNKSGEFFGRASSFNIINLNVSRIRDCITPLFATLKQEKPDILINFMWPLTFLGSVLALFADHKIKVINTEHTCLSKAYASSGCLHRIFLRITCLIAYLVSHRNVAVSNAVANDLSLLSKLPIKYFIVIFNPIEDISAKYSPSGHIPSWQNSSFYRILSIGSLKSVKNHESLIKSLSLSSDTSSSLMIVGEGPLRDHLQIVSRKCSVSHRVIFAGFHHSLGDFYASADLFVLPSLFEGFGNVLVEAMQFGLPIIVHHESGGPIEVLNKKQYGYVVNCLDPIKLARLLESRPKPKANPHELKTYAQKFSPDSISHQYISLFS